MLLQAHTTPYCQQETAGEMVKAETMTDTEDRKMEGNNILENIEEMQIIKRKN